MKLLFPPYSFCRLIAWSALAPVASFAANVGGNPSFYDTDNWYGYRSNSNIQFSSTGASIQFTQLDKSSYLWTYFDPITLFVGEKLSFSGTFIFGNIASGGVFSLGFFNSGSCGKEQMITHTYQSGTPVSSMANYREGKNAVSTATGGMTGVSASNEKAYLRTNAGSSTAFLSASGGAQQKTVSLSSGFSAPVAAQPYEVALEILKTVKGLDFSVSFGGGAFQTVSFETDISSFDVFGIRSPVTASGNGITLSKISLTEVAVPEPSAFGGVIGIFSIMFAAMSRRRRTN